MAKEMATEEGFTDSEIETAFDVLNSLADRYEQNDQQDFAQIASEAAHLTDSYRYIGADWSTRYDLPEVGDVVTDPESNPRYGDGRVKVSQVLDTKEARLHYVDVDTGERSVAWLNPSHPGDAPVVLGRYVEGSDKVYAFPSTRLE